MASHAKTESDIYDQMHKHLDRHGGRIGATSPGWTQKKRTALDLLADTADDRGDVLEEVIDIGLGDMSHVATWSPFLHRTLHYYGIDGSERILANARAKHPEADGREYALADISELITFSDLSADAIICLDVLYHIPSEELFEEFCEWLAFSARRYLLVSYATAFHTMGDPKKAGDPGWAWFPRPYHTPEGFETIALYQNTGCNQPQRQALSLLRRID